MTEGEELEYYKNRKMSGRQKHNAKWMSIYNDFVVCHQSGMTMAVTAMIHSVIDNLLQGADKNI